MIAIGYYAALTVIVFLVMLNGFLRGTRTPYADAILGPMWITVLGLGFYLFSWKLAVLNVVLSFVIGVILRPIARRLGAKLNP